MTKKYGYYEGILTQEGINAVKNGAEIELYLTINSLGDFIWRMNHDAAHGRFEMTESIKEDLEKAQYAIEFAVLNSCRFGIEIPEPKENEHVQRTESYNKWFRWWNNYFQYLPI